MSRLRKSVIWRVPTSSLSIECLELRPRNPMYFKKLPCQHSMVFLMVIMAPSSVMVRRAQESRLPWRAEVSMTPTRKDSFLAPSSIYFKESLQPTRPSNSTSNAAILKSTWKRFVIYLMVSTLRINYEKSPYSDLFYLICAAKKTNLQVKDDKTRGLYV